MRPRASLVLPLISQAFALGREAVQVDNILYPFALCLTSAGNVEALHLPEPAADISPRDLYSQVEKRVQQSQGGMAVTALAIVSDVTLPESLGLTPLDAIRVFVETVGYARYFYLPYSCEQQSERIGDSKLPVTTFGVQLSVEAKPRYFP